MLNVVEAKSFIEESSWYQTIVFEPGLISNGCSWCGDPAWQNIKRFLPPLAGKRILDLGCNAGVFCVRAALMGAQECVGIDCNDWKKDVDYLAQADFVKEYFEEKYARQLPIRYIKGRMEDVLKEDLGHFDWCFAIASIYYTTDPEFVVKRIASMCDNVIIRLRDENHFKLFDELFKKYGFVVKDQMQEKWWEVLERETDDFYLYYYGKRRD